MADITALYGSLLAADDARDAAALTAVAWQVYGELATTAADLCALRARFRVYAAAPHASGRRLAPRGAQTDACGGCVAGRLPPGEMSVQMRKLTAAASVSLGTVEPPAQAARPGLGPDLPCTNDPELFFAESPDDAICPSQTTLAPATPHARNPATRGPQAAAEANGGPGSLPVVSAVQSHP